MGYRASRQASTKHSPYYILFQQHMRLPINNEVLPRDDQQEDEEDLDQKIGYLLALRRKNFKQTESNIVTAQQVFSTFTYIFRNFTFVHINILH